MNSLVSCFYQCFNIGMLPILLLLLINGCDNVQAQDNHQPSFVYNAEQTLLLQISKELGLLERLTKKAQSKSNTLAAERFDYAALQDDVHMIRQAVLNHLSGSSRLPRVFKPLHKNYKEVDDE